jgi:hypothetical protein
MNALKNTMMKQTSGLNSDFCFGDIYFWILFFYFSVI